MLALLFFISAGSTFWALNTSALMTKMGASAAASALRHRQEMANATARHRQQIIETRAGHRRDLAAAVARARARARIQRAIAAVPIVGAGAIVYFEEQEYRDWLKENPGGARTAYACEVANQSAQVIDDVLAELPERIRPSPQMIGEWVPECHDTEYSPEKPQVE